MFADRPGKDKILVGPGYPDHLVEIEEQRFTTKGNGK